MELTRFALLLSVFLLKFSHGFLLESSGYNRYDFDKIRKEVASYKDIANRIIDLSVYGAAQNQSYNRLAALTDKFGYRLAGSQTLEDAIDYMLDQLKADALENVHGEKAEVPHWVRGEESATMLKPRIHRLPMLGLGYSIGTGPKGITAEVIVVKSFDELENRSSEVPGKIVVYNNKYEGYGISVRYRASGAAKAAKLGAVASLIRSVTPLSVDSPHTGMQDYEKGVNKIPTACITVEDAEMMWRMAQRGEKIEVFLNMSAQNLPTTISRNTVAEIKGSTHPEQVVLVSGHLDSWDVGQGAMDDGGGAFISWQALSLVRQLGLRPKRTLRMVLWTAEEFGGIGAQSYYEQHKNDVSNFDLVMESDEGTFTPTGIDFNGNANASKIMTEVLKLLQPINASILDGGGEGTDIGPWMTAGVPGASLKNQNDKYFYFHHTNGDTMTVQDPVAMNLCSAVWAVTAYVVADLDDMLPRDKDIHISLTQH
ncbi:carboxypeptidase Q-like isoform X2 [Mercenaria mercenaria]|uniref:carboxypeptidase Q-like isoform X2 n=1 Tax=Mercenaria mercenaria TaxID=6596 RepID=UPI00234F17D8|nr:carboxypeptidase Q-like isoform X2 [Mercenaria mercenaria]